MRQLYIFGVSLFALIGLLWPLSMQAQSRFGPYEYVSPRPDATLVSAGTTIAVRHGDEIDASSVATGLFTVTGAESGAHSGTAILADDNKTVIFQPDGSFTPEEVVSVTINPGLATTTGTTIADAFSYDFTVSALTQEAVGTLHAARLARTFQVLDADYGAEAKSDADQSYAELSYGSSFTQTQSYATIPSTFPHVSVTVPANGTGDGYIFAVNLTRRSAFPYLLILDNNGDPVFYRAMNEGTRFRDLRLQPNGLLTYYHTPSSVFYALDNSYNVVGEYKVGNGYKTDFHGLQVNAEGYSLLQIYDDQPIDMSQVVAGGLVTATVTGSIVQEVDPSGNVIFEWRSWDHFEILDASDELDFTSDDVDVTHINSADWDSDGNIIMSNRNIDEVTKVSRATADIIWRFGGKKNQFTLTNADGEGVDFPNWQHDARRQATGTMTVYDNGNHREPPRSRAVAYELDEENLTATQVWQYRNDPDFYGRATGNVQRLANGNSVINWGGVGIGDHLPFITEVKLDGTKAYEAYFVQNESTYRSFRFPWEGRPFEPPMLTATSIGDVADGSKTMLHFSWNGATDVASYNVLRGNSLDRASGFELIDTVQKDGFETIYEADAVNDPCTFYFVRANYADASSTGLESNLLFAGNETCNLVVPMQADTATDTDIPLPLTESAVGISAPAGVVSGTVSIVLNELANPTYPSLQNKNFVLAFALDAQVDGLMQQGFEFNQPISLTVEYGSAISAVDATTLEVRRWDPREQAWRAEGIALSDLGPDGQPLADGEGAFSVAGAGLLALFAEVAEPTALDDVAEPMATSTISDGSFEMNPSDSPWAYQSNSLGSAPLSCESSDCGYDFVPAKDGDHLVFVGFFNDAEQVAISQEFAAPALGAGSTAKLSLWIMRQELDGSVPFTGNNSIRVLIDETELLSVTGLDLQEGRYVELTADVTDLLSGTHTVQILGSFEKDGGAFYLDSVGVEVEHSMFVPFITAQ